MKFKSKKSKNYCKYNKINQQKKFHLLTLVLKDKLLIKEAAKIVGINYSTAKTIIFFHRNQGKSYQFDFRSHQKAENDPLRIVASFLDIPMVASTLSDSSHDKPLSIELIEIVSTIGSKQASIDLNTLQTRFMDKHLNPTISPSPKLDQLVHCSGDALNELNQTQNCRCERRITRAQSAKQAAQDHFCPPAHQQENSAQESSYSQSLESE